MKCSVLMVLLSMNGLAQSSSMIPLGDQENSLYYKIGGSDNYSMPPVAST